MVNKVMIYFNNWCLLWPYTVIAEYLDYNSGYMVENEDNISLNLCIGLTNAVLDTIPRY